MMKTILTIASILLLAACSVKLAPVAEQDLARANEKFPGTTLDHLNQGKTLYIENCGKCHGLKKPDAYSEEQWRRIVPPMARKAKISEGQEDLVLRYLVTKSGG